MAEGQRVDWWCQRGEHEECGHKMGSGALLFRPKRPLAVLCTCGCHRSCPLGNRRRHVAETEWSNRCTCPGSDQRRERDQSTRAEIEAQRAQLGEVFRDIDVGEGRSAEEIQAMFLGAFAAHSEEPVSDFSRVSRFVAAGTARRGTRSFRLLRETASALRAARNWTPPPGSPFATSESDNTEGVDTDHGRDVWQVGLTLAACAALAVGAAVGAHFTRGIVRAFLLLLTTLLAVLTAWMGLWGGRDRLPRPPGSKSPASA